MSEITYLPALIMTLSRDKVRLQLWKPEVSMETWTAAYPLRSDFIREDIASAMDLALEQHPGLIEDFDCVEVITLDKPHVCIPEIYQEVNTLTSIAHKYLRHHAGDTLLSDPTAGQMRLTYPLPTELITVIREYYANADHYHMISLLWSALNSDLIPNRTPSSRVFYLQTGNQLMVLCEKESKLVFSKVFHVRDAADVMYFSLACNRLLRPQERWQLELKDGLPGFDLPDTRFLTIDQHVELPALSKIIAGYRSCVS